MDVKPLSFGGRIALPALLVWLTVFHASTAAAQVITAEQVTPAVGSGVNQIFTLRYSSSAGAANVRQAWVWFIYEFSPTVSANSCLAYYDQPTNKVFLLDDTQAQWFSAPVGIHTPLQNSQCSVSPVNTTVTASGNTLTVQLEVTFFASYVGVKNVFMFANNATVNSGWVKRGVWSIPNGPVRATSVVPATGSGTTQTFALQYSNSGGAANFTQAWAWFASLFQTAGQTCLAYYDRPTNRVNLLNDQQQWVSAVIGSAATLQSSQCSLAVTNSSVSLSGNVLTLNLRITFASTYTGTKNILMFASNSSGTTSGWQALGTWTVPTGQVTADSVSPSLGSGFNQTFSMKYSNTTGATNLTQAWAWFTGDPTVGTYSCLIYYDRTTNLLNLLSNDGTVWMPATMGSATALQNRQCTINVGSSSVSLSGNTLTMNLAMTFQSRYSGDKNIYLFANSGNFHSGWQQRGGPWRVYSCEPQFSPSSFTFPASGGDGSVQVTTPAGCEWTASNNVPWITFVPGTYTGSGNGTLLFSVAPNSGLVRSSEISFQTVSIPITQTAGGQSSGGGSPCPTSISANQIAFTTGGGASNLVITADSACRWTISGLPPWLSVSDTTGMGSAVVTITAQPNASSDGRGSALPINGLFVGVIQSGTSGVATFASNASSYGDILQQSNVLACTGFINTGNRNNFFPTGLAIELDGQIVGSTSSNWGIYSLNVNYVYQPAPYDRVAKCIAYKVPEGYTLWQKTLVIPATPTPCGNNPPILSKGFRPETTVTYKFEGTNWSAAQQACVTESINNWSAANQTTGLKVTFTPWLSGQGSPKILLVRTGLDVFPDPVGGKTVAQVDSQGFITDAYIRFTDVTSFLSTCGGFKKVALHEFGHLMGLGDASGQPLSTVMNRMAGPNDGNNALASQVTSCDASQAFLAKDHP